MNILLYAKNDSGNPYSVRFEINNGVTSINCDCAAAKQHMTCKHVISLYLHDPTMLHDDRQSPLLDTVISNLAETSFFIKVAAFQDELERIEQAHKALDKEKKMAKAMFARLLREGIGGPS